MSIRDNIEEMRRRIAEAAAKNGRNPDDVVLIAVTKLHTPEEINEAIDAGITDIGENKVQEMLDKYDRVKPVRWHLIGHLQTNKVKYIIEKAAMIHSVDSLHLAQEISRRAGQHGRIMDILVQVNTAHEESKFGVSPEEAEQLIADIMEQCPNVRIRGIMCIAPYADDSNDIRGCFNMAKEIYDRHEEFSVLSMGMSHDFETAIEEGSTAVRIGTSIFGNRNYRKEEK